jgi:class 3 adenylate cyclase
MDDEAPSGPPLPEHPELRDIALGMESAGISGEILDANWQLVFISTEEARIIGVPPEEVERFYGKSLVVRNTEDAEIWGVTDEVGRSWWRQHVPIMRSYLAPGDKKFEEVFGPAAGNAARVKPVDDPPRAWHSSYEMPAELGLRQTVLGDLMFLDVRIDDRAGSFTGVLRLSRSTMPDALLARLGRGDRSLFERMDRVRQPARRQAAILFADLGSSSVLSRRLSSRGYFDLISGVTNLMDASVIAHTGIVGKHAGDGGSALFLTDDFGGSESAAARAAIQASRAIRDGANDLAPDDISVQLNIGLHWGSTLMVGQVTTSGRLEVTALGDQMNEAARIEAAATDGAILASKDLMERLEPDDAAALDLDPDRVTYTPLGDLPTATEKARRDAPAIAVCEV